MGNLELWEVACLKLHITEVVELGFQLGLSEYTAAAFSFGRIIPISPLPRTLSQRQKHSDLDLVLLHGWCYGRTNKRKVIVSIRSSWMFSHLRVSVCYILRRQF